MTTPHRSHRPDYTHPNPPAHTTGPTPTGHDKVLLYTPAEAARLLQVRES